MTYTPHTSERIREIAHEVKRLWKPVSPYALPYLDAMRDVSDDGWYINDSAKSIVLYFLANAQTWRGEDTRRLKSELKSLVAKLPM